MNRVWIGGADFNSGDATIFYGSKNEYIKKMGAPAMRRALGLRPGIDIARMSDLSGAATVTLKSSRTITGTWTITGLTPWRPLFLTANGKDGESTMAAIQAVSGSENYTHIRSGVVGRKVGDWTHVGLTASMMLIPYLSTVVLDVKGPWSTGNFNQIDAWQ